MYRTLLFAWMCCALFTAGCQWAITPDRDAGPAEPLRHDPQRQPALVEMGPTGPGCTVDQGDERPMVRGRCYVLVYVYRDERTRAYGLKQLLADRGLDVVVGLQPRHGMYFVRSRKGYNIDDAADLGEMTRMIQDATAALAELDREHPDVLNTTVRNIAPYIFHARRP